MSDASVLQARLVGALFVERGLLTDEQLERALELQAETGDLLGEILVTEFDISRIELASVLAEQWAELEQEHARHGDEEPTVDAHAGQPTGTAAERKRIGEIFLERGYIVETELDKALEDQKGTGQPLGEVLIGRGSLTRLDLASALAEQWAGLEKIRPPAPKRVEGWQQVAPLEHAAAAAQGAARGSAEERPSETVDASLVESIDALGERVAALEARTGSDTGTDDVAGLRAAVDELREQLSAPSGELDDVEQRLQLLETQDADRTSRQDLESVSKGLSFRVDAVDAQLREAVAGATTGLDSVVETLTELQQRIDSLAAPHQPGAVEHDEIAALAARLDELAGAIPAVEALTARLDTVETAGSDAPWRDEVRALQAQLDELGTSASEPAKELGERLRAVEERAAQSPWLNEVAVSASAVGRSGVLGRRVARSGGAVGGAGGCRVAGAVAATRFAPCRRSWRARYVRLGAGEGAR